MKRTDRQTDIVLRISELAVSYRTRRGEEVAVRDASLTVRRGETVGLVGESGCGKSTIAFAMVGRLGPNGRVVDGRITFEGRDLIGLPEKELRRLRGDRIAMVYQDPMQALNPALKVGDQLAEVLTCHRRLPRKEAWERSMAMLRRVHMPDPAEMMARYPHQLSGGQQQRVVIAMALLNNPSLLILDEPTTALDVTVEAAVLDLIEELKADFDSGIVFITHNLGVLARVSDRVAVMYTGQMVEEGPVGEVFKRPSHPYTKGLLACLPRLDQSKTVSRLAPIRGQVPPPDNRDPEACIFAARCDFAADRCRVERPGLVELAEAHRSRCFFAGRIGEARPSREQGEGNGFNTPGPAASGEPLVSLEGLKVYYEQEGESLASLLGLGEKKYVKAVDDVSLAVARGRTLGIVGESGCGKSTLVKGLIGLEEVTGGGVEFMGVDITGPIGRREMDWIREMQMVFQNPDSTLNPAYPVGRQIARPIKRFKTVPRNRVRAEVARLLRAVRLDESYYHRLPRQLSGGEKQRVGIARALAAKPDLVICDEPVSALDVSVQAAVINLLLEIQNAFGTTMIFIAHDLSVVRYISDQVAVMYLGRIVEIGPVEAIYAPPYHPYTGALLSAVPIPDPEADQARLRLVGQVPSALDPPPGCRFHTRCPRRELLPDGGEVCKRRTPPWRQAAGGHRIMCHLELEQLESLAPVIHPAA